MRWYNVLDVPISLHCSECCTVKAATKSKVVTAEMTFIGKRLGYKILTDY